MNLNLSDIVKFIGLGPYLGRISKWVQLWVLFWTCDLNRFGSGSTLFGPVTRHITLIFKNLSLKVGFFFFFYIILYLDPDPDLHLSHIRLQFQFWNQETYFEFGPTSSSTVLELGQTQTGHDPFTSLLIRMKYFNSPIPFIYVHPCGFIGHT